MNKSKTSSPTRLKFGSKNCVIQFQERANFEAFTIMLTRDIFKTISFQKAHSDLKICEVIVQYNYDGFSRKKKSFSAKMKSGGCWWNS